MKIKRNQIFLLLFLAMLVTLTNFATEILAPDAETWLRDTFGENYKTTLLFLLLGGTLATLLLTDSKKWFKSPTSEGEAVLPDTGIIHKIKTNLKSRYEHRIRHKLAGREPVNLRKIPSSTGTSDEGAQNFITLPAEKAPSGMAELFDEARGRLLVVGAPGAGKTTLLLQLALALLEREDTLGSAAFTPPRSGAFTPEFSAETAINGLDRGGVNAALPVAAPCSREAVPRVYFHEAPPLLDIQTEQR